MTRLIVWLALVLSALMAYNASAQELRAEVRISTEQLGAVDKARYAELERALTDLINNTRWTDQIYAQNERIVCSFALKILSVEDDSRYKAELSVTASRPVFNTAYTTTTFVYRDKEFDFEYNPGQTIEYNPQLVDNQLVAIIAFYAQYIVSMDADSFAPLGGNIVRDQTTQLVAQAVSNPQWDGWRAFGSDNNRGALASVLSEAAHEQFRELWYHYHRNGLDVLESRITSGRSVILTQLNALIEYRTAYPNSLYLPLFETAKLDELVKIFSSAPADEKRQALEVCRRLFPTRSDIWQTLAR